MMGAAVTVVFLLGALLYFVPTMIAAARRANVLPVFLINLLTGWTTIGWFVALGIAAIAPSGDRPPGLARGHYGYPMGHPYAPGHPLAPGQGYVGPGQGLPPGQGFHPHPGAAGAYGAFGAMPGPDMAGQWREREFQTDLPYGGFGSTPYGDAAAGQDDEDPRWKEWDDPYGTGIDPFGNDGPRPQG